MGYDATWHGQVTITPPLTWPEIKNAPKLRDLELVRDETTVDTATGQTATITAKVLQPRSDWGTYSGSSIEPELNMLLTAFPGHEFTGAITADGPEGNHWRYVIRGREVVYETPRIVWPGDEPATVWTAYEEDGHGALYATEEVAKAGAIRIWAETCRLNDETPTGSYSWRAMKYGGLELLDGEIYTSVYVDERPVRTEAVDYTARDQTA